MISYYGLVFYSVLTPIVTAQRNQYSDNHNNNFSNSIDEMLSEFVFTLQPLSDFSKEFYHF